jgi:hypothetical protein
LEHVYAPRSTFNIAAVNLSLGSSDVFTSPCDSSATKAIIDQLRAADIATVIASGNESSTVGLSAPACISTAISVASTTDGTSGPADLSRISVTPISSCRCLLPVKPFFRRCRAGDSQISTAPRWLRHMSPRLGDPEVLATFGDGQ